MKVTGFSFIRNAIKYDYPITEAITSILPICDEFVVAVGNSDDSTLQLIKSISPKIKIVETEWDDSLREGGRVLAEETNKAFQAISEDTDWCFYIQGDEVVHEDYLYVVYNAMLNNLENKSVDGLLFNYLHFYGSYDYIGSSTRWYRKEIRVIRNNKNIYSYRDAQGFRKGDNKKLNVIPIDAYIYHYGWVRPPEKMLNKQNNFLALYNGGILPYDVEEFDYSEIDSLNIFQGSHPKVMKRRIEDKNWKFEKDISIKKYSLKEKVKQIVMKMTGGYIIGEYKNYKILK
ncbi:glycosyltransferase family protein [Flammeovirga agarivorans]|uniref:Glycosyltransferase family 2 protein n=1 Tax=Flammeovirga agarivorans TaxID=2726742 RepID=A0A7X8SMZ4_9BACT|nr:glycosyltransferase family 2 protein [Flammeovirga agarivorans]NLR93143.1 glycosyltransferase family 2 protein [Flammeovirga agarivorans]